MHIIFVIGKYSDVFQGERRFPGDRFFMGRIFIGMEVSRDELSRVNFT